jgi:hypothetical protein
MQELESVVLAVDWPEWGLVAGDVGTIVHVYGEGEAYEVEFTTLSGVRPWPFSPCGHPKCGR